MTLTEKGDDQRLDNIGFAHDHPFDILGDRLRKPLDLLHDGSLVVGVASPAILTQNRCITKPPHWAR
jgi:hypothetical protein